MESPPATWLFLCCCESHVLDWSLPAKCHCWGHHSRYLWQHVSVSQDVHNLFSTQFFYRIFFFSNGFRFGTTLAFWSSQLHRENLKKYKSDIFILLKLLIYHPEPNTPWEDFPLNLVCRVHDSEPASVQSKLQRKDPASLFLNFMQVQTALPHGTEQHVLVLFFFLPYLSYFECKRRNQRQTLSPKRGEKCAYLPSSSVIYQSVLRAAAHGAPLAHLDLHFVYYVQHPGATVTGIWWEQTC